MNKTIVTLVSTFLLFFGPSIMTVIAFREYKRSMEKQLNEYVEQTNDKLNYLEHRLEYLERNFRGFQSEAEENFTTLKDQVDSLEWKWRSHGR